MCIVALLNQWNINSIGKYKIPGAIKADMTDAKFLEDTVPDKTCVIVGTRPGIIKMSPIIDELDNRDVDSFIIHAGQHYSHSLDGQIFEDLRLDEPDYHLENVKKKTHHGEQTAAMLTGIERALLEEQPENVLVCGDANFNLAGALAARKLRLTLGHVEAGLRSDDWRMPEEHNRVMIDHISDYLFAPTERAVENATEDNVKGKVLVTGNTVVDALQRNLDVARSESSVCDDLGVTPGDYVVFTAHREENVDDKSTLTDLIEIIERTSEQLNMPVVYPIHPRTEDRLAKFNLQERIDTIDNLCLVDPLSYLDFIKLLGETALAMTDSGGIQEEACIMGVPCVTLRENTERPETVEVGANVIAGTDPDTVLDRTITMVNADGDWNNPFGDGTASKKIVDTVLSTSDERV
ncbi:UDP-N-acetylglucosamine 2-epimerase [Halorubrum distributum JCM 9100]|uniref:UDP-N-acetylglucosamine 2-epimerase n=2 Tax=Halorubrum distributum TaxID=29283 RepID=M0EGY0_9EURY|nr:UDP-N-acetylglucosamine 2-epimerase [Halorubrum distributum JCM 9100]ELZ53528.1 UDP-N-acetylglucosamine 2-epimerase [Halorubrum distributum JCM 10118]